MITKTQEMMIRSVLGLLKIDLDKVAPDVEETMKSLIAVADNMGQINQRLERIEIALGIPSLQLLASTNLLEGMENGRRE